MNILLMRQRKMCKMYVERWGPLFTTSLLLPLLVTTTATAKIVVTGVLPHGDFVFDPSLVHNKNGSLSLHGNASLLAVCWGMWNCVAISSKAEGFDRDRLVSPA